MTSTDVMNSIRMVNVPGENHNTLQDAKIFELLQQDIPFVLTSFEIEVACLKKNLEVAKSFLRQIVNLVPCLDNSHRDRLPCLHCQVTRWLAERT